MLTAETETTRGVAPFTSRISAACPSAVAGVRRHAPRARLRRFEMKTSAGPVAAFVATPVKADPSVRPLVALHGISRDARGVAGVFAALAHSSGRTVIAPHFTARDWPRFQRVSRRDRPDVALLEMLATLKDFGVVDGGRFELFGYSGGAQLAHRFAMIYPQRVSTLHLGAAGWYCLPTKTARYPYGLAPSKSGDATWPRRKLHSLDAFLALPIRVYIGLCDSDDEAPALRRNAELDALQGANRLERARSYVSALRAVAAERGVEADVALTELPGCGHDFNQCVRVGGLARMVLK